MWNREYTLDSRLNQYIRKEKKMFDINEKLNHIIFKYHLDRCYPQYRNMYEAEKILRALIKEIIENNRSAIFIGNNKTELDFIRNISGDYEDIQFFLYNGKDMSVQQMEKIDRKNDSVYLVSFYEAEYMERWLRLHDICYQWIYDIFERKGLFLQREFLSFGKENLRFLFDKEAHNRGIYAGSMQAELYCQQSKYNYADDAETKHIALEKCLFLTLYMRNFVAAKRYAFLLMEEDEKYVHIWEEIQSLLDTIKKAIGSRTEKDIILYWLDAIPYGGESNMPYLRHVMESGVVFENAFTYMPYTNPTLRAMFLGKREIDDKAYLYPQITQQNSPVLSFLDEQGYDIKVFSGHFNVSFQTQYQPECFIPDGLVPFSMKLWDMFSGMLKQKKKTLWVIHALEAHYPYLSSKMNDDNSGDNNKRHRLAKEEVDEQLAFYDAFVNRDVYRIYMSDHGKEAVYKYHTLFNVYHRTLAPRKINELFSLLDFGVVLKQIVTNGDIEEKAFYREYVEIGNCDWYNRGDIKTILQNKEALSLRFFGCKGIADKEYIYIHYRTGKEWLHKRNDMLLCEPLLFYDCEDDVSTPELLMKYRELAGEYPEEVVGDEKFRYSRYLYVLYQNIMKHNNMNERIDAINEMLRDYPANSVGIRMGGVASSVLYYVLSKESKEKIWGFIDKNENCLCSKLTLPVVTPDRTENLDKTGIKAILLPSYSYLETLREETKTWPEDIDVLDIYDYFDRNGIRCREDFYKLSGTNEDYNVGFPFEEE